MRNNLINKKKLYINYLFLMFFHGLNFTHIRYKGIILLCFTPKSMLNIKNTIIKLNSNFMNNLNSTNNNYNNNSNKFIIFKGNSYNHKNLIRIYKKKNQILKQELFLMILIYNKISTKLFQNKLKINKINFNRQQKHRTNN